MTHDNSGMPPLPEAVQSVEVFTDGGEAVYGASGEYFTACQVRAAQRQVAQMCAELCERFAERQMSPDECAAAINKRFGLEKP